ncbi:MAG TPA: NAD(P)-dependent oxidoreductase [Arachnia sp.]|jgi:nucleoside-diphosphate-sugar epimerase|nr:NAD(P)-dependent oxidoreductase [Propionibacteriaceae bacterium]HOA27760.1 NAD(P)-dependent oxidoreductase [Arachnia sp.]HQD21814.1 NAD(P)-dependent oxidoreductase [Arachnia sp.]
MVVAVFGASGKFGRFVVEDLRGHGYHVVGFDRAAGDGVVAIDMRDYGQVAEAIQGVDERHGGVDAVVHLAAIPAPGLATDATTFHNNVPATYNVFKAAAAAGVRNVVWTSSETTLGLPMGPDNPPPYLPVDEDVLRPETTYALGKHLEEAMAEQFARWHHGMKLIGLRLSNVMRPEDYAAFDGWQDDPLTRIWNVWGYIDGRDGAQAVRLALESGITGFERFIIANSDTVMRAPSAELADRYLPDVPRTREIVGRETLLSIEKARRLLGYEPAHNHYGRP